MKRGIGLDMEASLTNKRRVLPEGGWAEGRVRRMLSVILGLFFCMSVSVYQGVKIIILSTKPKKSRAGRPT